MRAFWPAGLALALAITLVLLIPASPARRVSNLDIAGSGLSDTFLVLSRRQSDRCRVVSRRDSTMRRFDARQPGRNRDCFRIPGRHPDARADSWLVKSKRKGEGTALFVPVYDVGDWTYPFLYSFVRQHGRELELPLVEWTQLFINRLYQGLYLRVEVPFDLRRKDGGSGTLRQLLAVRDGRLSAVDTRFRDAHPRFRGGVEAATLPQLRPTPPRLAWLARRCPTTETTFLMSNVPPYELSLLPLPVSWLDLFEAKQGHPAAGFEDERYSHWTNGSWRSGSEYDLPFSGAEIAELVSGFRRYALSFRRALQADAELHRSQARLRELLPTRQEAVAGLQLELSEL